MSHGKFIWFDFFANDVDAALAFYSETMGWKVQKVDMPSGPYQMLSLGEMPFGGVVELPAMARAAGAPPHWMSYVTTEDVDRTAARTEELGGRVLQPAFDVPGVGRIAILADPQGAAFAVYAPDKEGPTPDPAQEGAFGWSELATVDAAAAVGFYRDLFGWAPTGSVDMGPAGNYEMFGYGDGGSRGGIFPKPDEMPMSAWLYYVSTADLDAAIARVERHGGKVLHQQDVQGGRIAQCVDPQGGMFAFHQATAG